MRSSLDTQDIYPTESARGLGDEIGRLIALQKSESSAAGGEDSRALMAFLGELERLYPPSQPKPNPQA